MKIGIAGSGMIVGDFLNNLTLMSSDIKVSAICVRPHSEQKGRDLAENAHIPHVYTNYDEMLNDKELDFVYVAVANQVHFEYAKKALEHGKNVIMEKPFTASATQAVELFSLAEDKNLFLFEAITSIHTPVFKLLKSNLSKIGEPKLIQANFSQYSSRYDRYQKGENFPAFDRECYGGTLYDLNVYNIHLAVGLLGMPQKTEYIYNRGWSDVDTSGILTLSYDGCKAVLSSAKDSGSPSFFTMQGTKGYAKIDGKLNSCPKFEMQADGEFNDFVDEKADFRMVYEFDEFNTIWKTQDFQRAKDLAEHTVMVMKVLDSTALYGEAEI